MVELPDGYLQQHVLVTKDGGSSLGLFYLRLFFKVESKACLEVRCGLQIWCAKSMIPDSNHKHQFRCLGSLWLQTLKNMFPVESLLGFRAPLLRLFP